MAIDTRQIQGAITTLLRGDATLTALVDADKIGTYLKQDVAFPHIIWEYEDEDLGTKGENGLDAQLTFEIWCEYRGYTDVHQIRDAIVALLHESPISIASGDGFLSRYQSFGIVRQDDGLTVQGILTFKLMFGE